MAVPPKPAVFAPHIPPPGVDVDLVSFWQDRPTVTMKTQHVHTNAAQGEGSVESSKRWAEAVPNSNTLPHFQVDRSGRAAMFLPTNRRGIGSTTVRPGSDAWGGLSTEVQADILANGNVREWTIVIETADTGTITDPTISEFTEAQAEKIAVILAYNSIVWPEMSLQYPEVWWGAGTATHTEPFGFPYTTLFNGKICPGSKKKAQMRDLILPRAREIQVTWLAPPPPPPPPDEEIDMYPRLVKFANFKYAVYPDGRKVWLGGSDVPEEEVHAAIAARLQREGKDSTILQMNDDDPHDRAEWKAMGYIAGGRSAQVDRYGFRKPAP